MAVIKSKSGNRSATRTFALAAVPVILFFALHVLFVNNARSIFKKYITEQSHGKIAIEMSRLDLNLWSNRLQIHEAELVSTGASNEPITYHVSFSRVSVKVGSIWQLLFQKKLQLDSLKLYNPVIQVILWRKDTSKVVLKDELSIPQEMGKVYNSLLSALDQFSVRRIIIDNAAFSLVNKMKPGSEPVTVSRIFLDLSRTPAGEGNKKTYFNKEQKIELRTSHQSIALPGGRHRLSFQSFRLRLLGQSIELDSCTVTAMPTDSVKSNYKVFFKKLSLTGVDFSALSRNNLIKADTVYCEDPFFDLNLYRSDAVKKKTEIPDPNKMIRDLTGNLNFGFVAVKNAGIHFDIFGKTRRSFFNSNKDNFEIKGFRVSPDSLQPASITRFNMTLRDYHLYNEDSSSMFSFDSLHFLNNRIVLNNFAILSTAGRTRLRNTFDIKIPYFKLSELDWYQLIFEQNMVAREAVLNDPVINFTRVRSGIPGKKFNLFAALLNLDSLVALDNVSVINGQVNGQLGPASSFNVQNIDLNISSNKLLRSTNKEGLRRAVEHLSFSKGELRLRDIRVRSDHARYSGNNLIYANKIEVSGKENKIASTVYNVLIDNLQLDDNADNIVVNGLTWDSATIALKVLPYSARGKSSNIELKNISGSNTQFTFSNGATTVSTNIDTLHASMLAKEGDKPIHVENFIVAGNDLSVDGNALELSAGYYKISGNDSSKLKNFRMTRITGIDTLDIQSSDITFGIDLNKFFARDHHLQYVYTTTPVINFSKWQSRTETLDSSLVLLPVRIDELTAIEPDITFSMHKKDSLAVFSVPGSSNSIVQAKGIGISGGALQMDSVTVHTTAATYVKPGGEIVGVENGKINMALSSIKLGKGNGKFKWSGFIDHLNIENVTGLQPAQAKNKIRLHQASLGNLYLSSDYQFDQLLKANTSAWLNIPSVEFVDSNKTLQWYNVNFINSTRTLTIDSFIYHPAKTLDSVLAMAPYQLDYITVKTGAVTVAGFDLESYKKDSSFIAEKVTIDGPVLTVYRDKQPPYSPLKKQRPLPVNMIKNMVPRILVNSVEFDNGTITYTEKNAKSRRQGELLFTHVNGSVEDIKNRDLLEDDSLSITFGASLMDSAHITLDLSESYTDSLSGFVLNARITGAELPVLNPVLVPFLNVAIVSGSLDSVFLHAVGRQDMALGEMSMHYHKLRVRLVKDGIPGRSTIMQRVTGLFANTFVIKSKNTNRKGMIFTRRSGQQSFVNYIVRISLSGIMSTIGIRSNKKYAEQYRNELKYGKQPAIKL